MNNTLFGRRCVGLALVMAWMTGSMAHAETIPAHGAVDPRIRSAPYSPEQVYRLQGFVGYQIDLQFEPGEQFVGLGAGDIDGISFVAQDNHLFLKPKVAKVGTNLTILTTRRTYQVDYTASWKRPDPSIDEVIYALTFLYPPAPVALVGPTAEQIEEALAAGAASRPRNVDYWFCGNPSLRPVAASDDGVQTRVRFSASGELPALFVRNEDGSESLLNFSVDGEDVVVHRVARRLILRRGKVTGCIVNQGWQGGGERLDSHTVSPSVERVTGGGAP